MPLTDIALKTAKGKKKVYKLFDSGGLYAEVPPKGNIRFRVKYYFGGKEKRLSVGVYPTTSLKEAREARNKIRKQVALGIDPSAARKEIKAQAKEEQEAASNTYEKVATDWFNRYRDGITPNHAKKLWGWLEKHIFPAIGHKHVADITPQDIMDICKIPESKGFYTATENGNAD